MPDKFFQKKINRIIVECQFKQSKCDWKGTLIDYKEHYNEHSFPKIIICEYCYQEFHAKTDLDNHLNELNGDCLEQPVLCPYSDINCFIGFDSNIF